MTFEFATSQRILFGRGQFDRLGELCRSLGSRVFVVRGGLHLDSSGAIERLRTALRDTQITTFEVRSEPDLELVDAALEQARTVSADVVIGLGGGSVIDAAKAVAALLTHPGCALDYLEVVGRGQSLVRAAVPLIAIPTTAGAGTEVTKNAVLTVRACGFKASMRSEYLLPRIAIVDPSLTDGLPPAITASTGLDALAQLLEPYVSIKAQPISDALALQGLSLVGRSLRAACSSTPPTCARDDLSLAALLGGMCLANSGLGAVHGFAAPIGATFPVPHGVVCAALLPAVVRANLSALRQRAPESPALSRYARAFGVLMQYPVGELADPEQGAVWLESLVKELGIGRLREYGVASSNVASLVERAQAASSMRGNPVVLTPDELAACLVSAI